MSGRFRDLADLRISYTTSDDPLHTFYVPVLSRAKRLDRIAGYFTAGGLALVARGLARFIANGGRMRLLVGARLEARDVEAVSAGADLAEVTRRRLVNLFDAPQDEVQTRRLEALAWMVSTGALEIEVALPRDPRTGLPFAASDADGYFHAKNGVAADEHGDKIAWTGSNNETAAAWLTNYEEFWVSPSWQGEWVEGQVRSVEANFQRLWDNRHEDWITMPIPEAARRRLLEYTPERAPADEPEDTPQEDPGVEAVTAAWLRDLPRLIGVGKRLGRATAAVQPWPHQRRVADDIVEGFPDRFLLADEVGLGKTIEVGLALRDLILAGTVERCLILAPKSVLQQWRGELYEKFRLRAALYEGPGSLTEEPLLLVSSQLAKRKERRGEFLDGPDWDLVVVDEAHHARRKGFKGPGRRPNRLLELLEGVDGGRGLAAKTKGLLLLTATPMQIHPLEVWDLLIQLDLPGRWGASGAYFLRYFEALREAGKDWRAADWELAAAMARDERDHGGGVDAETAKLKEQLGWAKGDQLAALLDEADPGAAVRRVEDRREREALLAFFRRLTPLRRRMRRYTRTTLRGYQRKGLLPGKLAERRPEPRWVEMAPDERALYGRVEKYISEFYRKYEGERKGLGFVMTVYRRRLTSSFYALEKSLERRLLFLKGQGTRDWLIDEDLEEDELQLDIGEDLEESGRTLRSFYGGEIEYVEDFLSALRSLGTDAKYSRLVDDLQDALSRRANAVIFTQYTDTMDYLRGQLRSIYGSRIACYSGRGGERWGGREWIAAGKEEIKQSFRAGEIQILLGTDAMAEGLNLQNCGVEINYDVPWNPMRLEQRIGRVDRIGQSHRAVWIWSYFLEGTIEAEVYRRLAARIDWFKGVVGPLQPILHQVGRAVQELALTPPEQRRAAMAEKMGWLESEIARAEREGLDFDDHLAADAPLAAEPPPVSPAELERFFVRSAALGRRFRPHGEAKGAYLVRGEGVTFRPDTADQHPETLRLLTFGDPLFAALLAEFPAPAPSRFGIARVEAVDPAPPRAAWYRAAGDSLVTIESLDSLRKALDRPGGNPDLPADARGAFLSALENEQTREYEGARRRQKERASALWEKGRRILAKAAYVWLARHTSLFEGRLPPMTSETVKSMIEAEGYPFAPLAVRVGADIPLSPEDPDWLNTQGHTQQSLQNKRQNLKHQAENLLSHLEPTKPTPPDEITTIDAEVTIL